MGRIFQVIPQAPISLSLLGNTRTEATEGAASTLKRLAVLRISLLGEDFE